MKIVTYVSRRKVSNSSTGIGSCKSLIIFGALCLCTVTNATAQESSDQQPAAGTNTPAVQLNKFEVTTTQDSGYTYNNSAGAFRTNQPLLDIPQSDIVVTKDFIDDVGLHEASDVMAYLGMAPFQGESQQVYLRGGFALPFQDDMPTGTVPFADNAIIDSYEVIKGAAQVLYLNNGLNGTILEHTKKPLPTASDEIDVSVNSFGAVRAVGDFTGPIGTLDGVLVSFRLIAVEDTGKSYFVNDSTPHWLIMPELQFDFKKATIRVYYDRAVYNAQENANGLATADGGFVNTSGYQYAQGELKNGSDKYTNNVGYISIFNSFSDEWQNEFKGTFRNSSWYGSNVLPLSLDLDTNTLGQDARLIKINESDLTVMEDIQGNYRIGPTVNNDIAGFIWDQTVSPVQIIGPSTLDTGSPFYGGLLYEPINQHGDTDLTAPDPAEFNQAGNPETEGKITTELAYVAHSIDIGKYFTLTGGVSFASTDSLSFANINVTPQVIQGDQTSTAWLHRYGAVFKPFKGLSIYALESTTFAQPNPYDYEANGSLLPNVIGKDDEVGAKGDLWGGRINFDVAIFDLKTENIARLVTINTGGRGIWAPTGSSSSNGADADLNLALTKGWQFHASWFHTSNSLAYSEPMSSFSLFTSYRFFDGPVKGLTIGGGLTYFDGIYDPLSGLWKGSETPFMEATGYIKDKNGVPIKLFASYRFDKHLLVRASVDNLTNDHYPIDAPIPTALNLSNPTFFTFELDYKY